MCARVCVCVCVCVCVQTMMCGEALFYFFWCAAWFWVAIQLHPQCVDRSEKVLNWLAPISLLLGPGQILFVCALPTLYLPTNGPAQAEAMRL